MIKAPRPLPKPDTPVLHTNGLMARAWYDYFRELDFALRALVESDALLTEQVSQHEDRITDLETP